MQILSKRPTCIACMSALVLSAGCSSGSGGPPEAPRGLEAVHDSVAVRLTWNGLPPSDVDSYEVEGRVSTAAFELVDVLPGTEASDWRFAFAGDIVGIELALGAAPGGSAAHGGFFVDVLDEGGTLLATSGGFGRVASCCGLPPDLSAGSLLPTVASFTPAIQVTAGQRLELRLHPQTPLVAGTSTDVHGGGTLRAAGVADPSRDLAFKVVMQ